MSVVERSVRDGSAEQLPTFELECLYDSWEDPSAVTLFSTATGDDLSAAWLQIDREHAVSLAELQ